MRCCLFEFEDFPWLPRAVRDGMTDFLGFVIQTLNFYAPVYPLLLNTLNLLKCNRVIDLCSGSGIPIKNFKNRFEGTEVDNFTFMLSDKYPNRGTCDYLHRISQSKITYINASVDAVDVPHGMKGFRTVFSAAHHFSPTRLKALINSAVKNDEGIGIFDGGNKNILLSALVIILFPVLFLAFTPFIRPFKYSRLFFTYVIPLIPFFTIWDGINSILRLYEPDDMLKICEEIKADHYSWTAGKVKNKFGMSVSYVIGYPKQRSVGMMTEHAPKTLNYEEKISFSA